MKRLLWLFFVVVISIPDLSGQVRGSHKVKWYLEADVRSGTLLQDFKAIPLYSNYPSHINAVESKMKFATTGTLGYCVQLGYYFGKKNRVGIQTGLMNFAQQGSLGVDTFHVEYKSTDYKGNTFRQVITANNGIHETISCNNISIPLLLKYRQKITSIISVTLDAGVLYNLQMENRYTSNASFDYEAIYKMEGTGDKLTFLYDNSPKPDPQDWLITRTEFMKDNPTGNMADYFDGLKDVGFNVGLNKPIENKTGKVKYQNKSIGYMGQFGLNFKLAEQVILKFGVYYLSQSFTNPAKTNRIQPTSKPGEYTALMNFTKDIESVNYGVTVGLTFHFYSYADMTYDRTSNQSGK